MKTEVTQRRSLFGVYVSQKSKSEMLSGTELVSAGNIRRKEMGLDKFNFGQWQQLASTKEFIADLSSEFGERGVFIKGNKGRNSQTWLHPLLFIDLALAIHPKLKKEVYRWILDDLLKERNNSGDSFKKMSGALFARYRNKQRFPMFIKGVARTIQHYCGVPNHPDNWQYATQEQLKKRDDIQRDIALLADVINDPENAVELAIHRGISNETR